MNFDKSQESCVSNSAIIHTLSGNGLPSWETLGRITVIKQWADEIKEAISLSASLEDWQITGTAVAIIHDDSALCRQISAKVAEDNSLPFESFNQEQLENLAQTNEPTLNFASPSLIYLEPGDWMKSNEDKANSVNIVQNKLIATLQSFSPEKPIIFVTSASSYNDLSVELRKVGLFDRRFIVIKPTLEEIGKNFVGMIGEAISNKSLQKNFGKIGKLLDLEFDGKRRQELIALALKRIAKKEGRQVDFRDLVYLSTKGSAESDAYPKRSSDADRKIAAHEAGHATIAMVDSSGKNIPEYVSILEEEGYNGVVTDSVSYHLSKHKSKSYKDVRHQIRICLAGRVAEHFMYGAENVSVVSASDDLRKATELCFYMFSARGISSEMKSFEGAASNLTIELQDGTPFDTNRIEKMAREYLAKQYKIVYEMLTTNKGLYDSILRKLLSESILDQKDLNKIGANYKLMT